jgi:hypothetical protein
MDAQENSSDRAVVALCCDMLLNGKTGWIRRRKETLEFLSETAIRHRLSLDFDVADLPIEERGNGAACKVPVTLLRKEPGRFTRFDFDDESGRSLPLPTLTQNATISAKVLQEGARRVLLPSVPSPELLAELALIARAERDLALAILRGAYLDPQGAIKTDSDAANRAKLVAHDDYKWLLRTLAYSSVVVADLTLDDCPRRIVKLSYEEQVADVTAIRKKRLRAKLGAWGYRLGWRGYVAQFLSPFVGACSYHFELHAPEGMELLEAGMSKSPADVEDRHRVHLYLHGAHRARTVVPYVQFRIRGPGFVGAAFLTSLLIVGSLAAAWHEASNLVDTTTSAPALLLLFPGLVATYLARPAHALVSRLLDLARWTLILCAGIAYLAAGRLALVTSAHPADEHNLRMWLGVSAIAAAALSLVLLASWLLPVRLNHPLRRQWRDWRLKRKRG